MATSQKPKAATQKASPNKPGKKPSPKPPVVIEDDIVIPPVSADPQSDSEIDRSISVYPATVTTFIQDIRPPTPGVVEIKEKLKVNYDDFGFRVEERLREALKSLAKEVEAKERRNAELEQETATRKRLQAAAQATFAVADEGFLGTQVLARDRQIAVLSDRLFDVLSKAKVKPQEELKSKDKLIAALQSERDHLQTIIKQLEDSIAHKTDTEEQRITALELENERLQRAVEGLNEAVEAGKVRLEMREKAVGEARNDQSQLAKVVKDLTDLNSALSAARKQCEEEVEKAKAENFELRVKVASIDQLQSELSSLRSTKAMYEKQFEKLTQAISTLEAERNSIKQQCLATTRLLRKSISELNADSWEGVARDLEKGVGILEGLEAGGNKLDARGDKAKQKVESKETNAEIASLRQSISSLESLNQTYATRIHDFEAELGILRTEFSRSLDAKESELKGMREAVEGLKVQNARYSEQVQEREVAVAKANSHIAALNQKLETQKTALETQYQKVKSAEKQAKSLSEQLSQLHQQLVSKEKETVYRDKSLRELTQKLKVMEVELWNKDSDLLQREAKIVDLQSENNELRAETDQFNIRLRKAVAEELSEVNQLLEEKANQVELLKGMLRSSQTQVKQKDVDLLRYKRKSEKTLDLNSPRKVTELSSPKAAAFVDVQDVIENFCSQVARLRKFSQSKLEKIEAAAANGSLNSAWLKEELKLSKAPSETLSPREVLKLSIDQRVNALISQVQERCEGREAEDAIMSLDALQGEAWQGLSDTLRKYASKVLGERQ